MTTTQSSSSRSPTSTRTSFDPEILEEVSDRLDEFVGRTGDGGIATDPRYVRLAYEATVAGRQVSPERSVMDRIAKAAESDGSVFTSNRSGAFENDRSLNGLRRTI